MDSKRVVLVGGGVIGLCGAYYALKRGYAVTLLDRGEPDGDNCSMKNAGMVVPSHFIPLAAPGMIAKGLRMMIHPESPFFIRPRLDLSLMKWAWLFYRHSTEAHVAASVELLRDLNLESRRLFGELQAEEDFGLVQRGLLMLCRTAKGLDEEGEVAEAAHRIGLKAEVHDAVSTAALDPSVTMNVAGSVYFPHDCHLDPARFIQSMRRRIRQLGADVVTGVEVDRIETANGRAVAACAGARRFEGDHFVVAGGSWSARILATLGVKLPLQPGKGYSLTLQNPPELPGLCSIFAEAKVAITPVGSALRFGGTMEVGGFDLSVNPSRVQGILKSIPGYFPKFKVEDFAGVQPWAGLRPVSPDGVPYLGRVTGIPNLVAATGHAMMGMSLGPVSGRLIGDLIAGDEPFRPIESMAPGRF